jgi:hypothetical protein
VISGCRLWHQKGRHPKGCTKKDGTNKGGTLRTAFLNLICLERLFATLSD